MNRKKLSVLFMAFLLHLFPALSCSSQQTIAVKIFSPQARAPKAEFDAELAVKPAERAQGLMFRKELGKKRGMLFVFPHDVFSPFWMQNTLISLDMVFIDADKKIVSIVHRAEPQTTSPREAEGFYRYVLEIEGGRAEQLGIRAGDRVEFSLPAGVKAD